MADAKKAPAKGKVQERDDDDDFEAALGPCGKLWAIYSGKQASLIPLATFVFLQNTCFLLGDIGTTFLVISNIGVDFMPAMTLGTQSMNILLIPLGGWFDDRYYLRNCVKWSTLGTIVSFIGLWCIFRFVPATQFFLSGFLFMWREVCSGYVVECFWQMVRTCRASPCGALYYFDIPFALQVEESYNIQQAKKVFIIINYGTVFSLAFVGLSVFYIPWYLVITPNDLQLIGAILMIPCMPLMQTISPKGKPSKANAAKDREKVDRRLAKLKKAEEKRAKRLAKKMQGEEEKQLTAADFLWKKIQGPRT
jgi:hypothetical protein